MSNESADFLSDVYVSKRLVNNDSSWLPDGGAEDEALCRLWRGAPSKTAQGSLLSLSQDHIFTLATRSSPSANVLTTALSQPSHNELFHKTLVAALLPRAADLALSPYGHRVIEVVPSMPSRAGAGRSVPFHVKQTLIAEIGRAHV